MAKKKRARAKKPAPLAPTPGASAGPVTPEVVRPKGWSNIKPVKPGEVRNPTGRNGSTWLPAFRKFFGVDLDGDITKTKDPDAPQVVRLQNVLSSLYRQALLGNQAAIDSILWNMGINPANVVKMELTGADGAPLDARPRVVLSWPAPAAAAAAVAVATVADKAPATETALEGPAPPEGAG